MTPYTYRCLNRLCQWFLTDQRCELTAAEYTQATGRPFLCPCGQPLVLVGEHDQSRGAVRDTQS